MSGRFSDDTYREGLELKSDLIPAVVLEREDEDLAVRFHEGSGITVPEGRWVAVSRHPDGYSSDPSYGKLRISPDELEDYIGLLQEVQSRIDCYDDAGADRSEEGDGA